MSDTPASAARALSISGIAERLSRLTGWRRYGAAFLLGVGATLALPPVYVLPVLYIAFPALVWLLGGVRGSRAAFAVGWWFGFGWFTVSLYWIGNALLVFSDRTAWLVPFAVLGLPAFLALYTGLAGMVARVGRTPLERALWLAAGWTAAEWLRGHLLTGFPWNLAGYAWMASEWLMQSAAAVGVYGLTLLCVLSAALPAAFSMRSRQVRLWAAAAAALLLAVPWAGGALRMAAAPAPKTAVQPGVGLRIVQAGISQRNKWRRDLRERHLGLNLRLSIENRPDWVTDIVWPENAATFFVEEEPAYRDAMARVTPLGGLLITGAPRRVADPLQIWNSVFAIDVHGDVVGHYDKAHLVPFGEYMPLRRYIPVEKVAHGAIDYSAGPGPATLHLDGVPPVSPLVCYEAIFPGAVVDRSDRPAWLLNLTNDAWYGKTAGPHQHLAISRLRAVEEGLPLVRAANTGISAAFDPYGREIGRIGLDRQGVLDFRLPKPVENITPYGRFGDAIPLTILALFFAALALLRTRTSCSANKNCKLPRP
jgi:apolipoprotein N-acyltransferase